MVESLLGALSNLLGRGKKSARKAKPVLEVLENRCLLSSVTANISGTVFNDANGNGKQDSGEAGIAGVTVYIDSSNAGVFKVGDLETTTNSSGVYSFTGLAPGTYLTRQILPGGAKQTVPASGFGNHVTVTAGQTASANFGDEGAAV